MGKRKARERAQKLFENLVEMSAAARQVNLNGGVIPGDSIDAAASETSFMGMEAKPKRELLMMKKFRFQLMHRWLIERVHPCRVADVGGGKGLLSYLLQKSGWEATVIDPLNQALPNKYKDIVTNKRVRIAPGESVPRIDKKFTPQIIEQFDLIIGLHAHGCNIKIIDGAKEFKRDIVLMPCCIIDEPVYPRLHVHWLECLVDYAIKQSFLVYPFRLNFRGQNIGLYATQK